METDLEILWEKLKLMKEEECEVNLDKPVDGVMNKRGGFCLVGKVWSDRSQSYKVVKDTMMAVWRPRKQIEVKKMGDNLFLFIFFDAIDRRRVLHGWPWLLGKTLIVIQEFDSWQQLGSIRFDKSPFWGEFLRIKASLDLCKLLLRGMVGHMEKDCKQGDPKSNEEVKGYGGWLKASPDKRRYKGARTSDKRRAMSVNTTVAGDVNSPVDVRDSVHRNNRPIGWDDMDYWRSCGNGEDISGVTLENSNSELAIVKLGNPIAIEKSIVDGGKIHSPNQNKWAA
ncbi:hypothetical protein LguiB_034718 [Lonicera macranthoides]